MTEQHKTTGYTPEPGDTDADRLDTALAEIERLRAALRQIAAMGAGSPSWRAEDALNGQ